MNRELIKVINDIDRIIYSQSGSRERNISLAHRMDEFLDLNKAIGQRTSKDKLKKVRNALNDCNLPLTSLIFQQEAKLQMKNKYECDRLSFSPSVSIEVADMRDNKVNSCVQCDMNDDLLNDMILKHVKSLETIKDELNYIKEKYYTKQKQRKRKRYFNGYDTLPAHYY